MATRPKASYENKKLVLEPFYERHKTLHTHTHTSAGSVTILNVNRQPWQLFPSRSGASFMTHGIDTEDVIGIGAGFGGCSGPRDRTINGAASPVRRTKCLKCY